MRPEVKASLCPLVNRWWPPTWWSRATVGRVVEKTCISNVAFEGDEWLAVTTFAFDTSSPSSTTGKEKGLATDVYHVTHRQALLLCNLM